MLKSAAYADQLAHCAADGICYLRNDNSVDPTFSGRVIVAVTALATGKETVLSNRTMGLLAGPAAIRWFCAVDKASTSTPLDLVEEKAAHPEVKSRAGTASDGDTTRDTPSAKLGEAGQEAATVGAYTRFYTEIPSDRTNYTGPSSAPLAGCEARCDQQPACLGFTRSAFPYATPQPVLACSA